MTRPTGPLAILLVLPGGSTVSCASASTLFPLDLPAGEWSEFGAAGYRGPVCGVICRTGNPATNGMPVGGVDTGCLDLETSGLLGYCTLFNSHVPRRGPLGLPFLGLSVGGTTWVLCHAPSTVETGLQPLTSWQLQPDLGAHQRLWAPSETQLPAWFRSVGEAPFDVPAGRVACHSPACLRWTSPVTGGLRITGGLWLPRNLDRPQRWAVLKNGSTVTAGDLAWGPTSAQPQPLSAGSGGGDALVVAVEEGDALELVLTPAGGSGDYVGIDLMLTHGDVTWDLAREWSDEQNPNGPWTYDSTSRPTAPAALFGPGSPLRQAAEVHYWGHYPVADMEFETDAPVQVGLRAWSPFLPGDVVASMIPGAVFEVHLRNVGPGPQAGTLVLTFPGPTVDEAGASRFEREPIDRPCRGVHVRSRLASYALAVAGNAPIRLGGGLGIKRTAWAGIDRALPQANDAAGATVAVDFRLDAGKSRVIPFVLTWCAPTWKGGGFNASPVGNTFTHMYARHYPNAGDTAKLVARERSRLLRRIAAWQQVIYREESLPVWLRDSLINVLYMITEDGYWAQKAPPLPDWVREADGLFGMNECPRGCPQIECIPCSFYGSLPLAYFFPELQLSTIRGYQGYQLPDGAPPWIFGGCTGSTPPIDFACPTRGYQFASNGISLAGIVDRFLLCRDTPDRQYLRELYPMLKRSVRHTVSLRSTPSYSVGERIISMPDGNEGTEWFEAPEPGWAGMTAHIGGLHLAELRIAERMAHEAGDADFARQCADWIAAGQGAMDQRLWDERGYYLNYLEPETGRRSDLVFGYQLDGEWVLAHHGLAPALPAERIRTVLDTVKRCNASVTKYGAVNYANPDGTVANPGGYGAYSYFPPELLMLAMTYMYHGEREFGLQLAEKAWHNIVCRQGYTWDMPNIMRGDVDTGERTFGNDYYQDMLLWSLPAALADQTVDEPCKPGGLVERIMQAARA